MMLYLIIRIILWCLFLLSCKFFISKLHILNKCKGHIIVFAISLIFLTIISLIPIENSFVSFSSPQKSYRYNHLADVKMVVEGQKTDLVVGIRDGVIYDTIIPKTDTGWKLGMALDTKNISKTIREDIVFNVYQYKDSSDYFITILDTNGGKLTISDEYNTKFYPLERNNDSLGKTFVTYYAHITNFDPQYSMIVNDSKIVLSVSGGRFM